jgi:hypothetical protein
MPRLIAILVTVLFFAAPSASANRLHFGGGQVPTTVPFSTVTFGTFAKYGTGGCPSTKCISGDSWFNTWADDNNIYTQADDSSKWNATDTTQCCNLMFSTLSDFSPTMTGTQVNLMASWNGGTSPDGGNWKGSSLISVRGTLILSVIRLCLSGCPANMLSWSSQLITSIDHGVTWTPVPPVAGNPYTSPMFVDPKFRAPMFFQYGQDYQTQTADRSNQFVYAISPDQTSPITGRFYLGRVPVGVIANVSAADWKYYQGGDGNDSTQDAVNWGALSTAVSVFTDIANNNNWAASPIYLPAFGTYLLIQSFDNTGVTDTIWHTYQGAHPWGPWTMMQTNEWNTSNIQAGGYGFYYPAVIPKSLSGGGRTMALIASADYTQWSTVYTIWIVPVTIN